MAKPNIKVAYPSRHLVLSLGFILVIMGMPNNLSHFDLLKKTG